MALTEQAPDKDLNMIQPAETGTEAAFKELLSNGGGQSIDEVPATRKEAVANLQDSAAYQGSLSDQSVDSELDFGKSMFEDVNSTRARNQSEFIKGVKAVGGGIYTGGLIALEQAGYAADLDTYTNLFKETEDLSGNWWTRLMKEAQESGRESDMFKIYEEAPDENSIMSQIFKWSSLEGAVSSAVGFGISGLGATKLVSFLGSMKRFKDMARFTDIAMGNITGKGIKDSGSR